MHVWSEQNSKNIQGYYKLRNCRRKKHKFRQVEFLEIKVIKIDNEWVKKHVRCN